MDSKKTARTDTKTQRPPRKTALKIQKKEARKQGFFKSIGLFSSIETTLMRKDLNAIWRRKGIRALLMIMPAVLVVVIPLAYFATISLLPVPETAHRPEVLLSLLSSETAGHGYRQFWMDAFTSLMCPMLFLAVPIVCAVTSAACVFVSEKENHTLETLLLSPMSSRSIFNTKITVCVMVTIIISVVSFFVFAITVSVADIVISAPFFMSLEWLVTLFLLMPSVTLFSVVFVTLLIHRVGSVGECLQTVGYILFPFLVLFLIQFTGAIRLNALFLGVLSVVLFAVSVLLFNFSARRFNADSLFSRTGSI